MRFLQKSKLRTFMHNLRLQSHGYILILVAIFIPLLLYGVKYTLDLASVHEEKPGKFIKKCAKEAALEVAKKWNPALTLDQQKETMYRIADGVYNKSPAYNAGSLKYNAIPGLEMPTKVKVTKGRQYDPLKVEAVESKVIDLSTSARTIAYTNQVVNVKRSYTNNYYSAGCAPVAEVHFNFAYDACMRDYPLFSTEDLIENYCYYCGNSGSPLTASWYQYVTLPEVISIVQSGFNTCGSRSYSKRSNVSDNKLKIECSGDKIKVTTDEDVSLPDIGYATPARCEVDIVLSVPTNGAACNQNNYDTNTITAGTPYISTSSTPTNEGTSTPICQVTRAYRKFLKENFFYTQGVNAGVIPYSGNVSLKGTRFTTDSRNDWVQDFPRFNPNNIEEYYLKGALLYNSPGSLNADLSAGTTYASGRNHGSELDYIYALLCRSSATVAYNGHKILTGDLLSTAEPTGSLRFYKQTWQPCLVGYANLLSGKCEQTCPYQWMNPFFILELNNNLKFIYEMLGAFYPYYDDNNNSNFLFIPVTWANNLFQSWSSNPYSSNVNSTASSPDSGKLSSPDKMTSGRKKALILIANKPDWFQPGELTYLGFDNDYSEVPMIESDVINFGVDYSDTSRKFADGTAYDGTIQGAKKILKFSTVSGSISRNSTTGYYECANQTTIATGKLSFPRKNLIKLIVEQPKNSVDDSNWTAYSCNLSSMHDRWYNLGAMGVGPVNGEEKMLALGNNGILASSSDGINWTRVANLGVSEWYSPPTYDNGKWIAF